MPAPKAVITNEMVAQMVASGLVTQEIADAIDTVEKQALRAVEGDLRKQREAQALALLKSHADELLDLVVDCTSTLPMIVGEKGWKGWTLSSGRTDLVPGFAVKVVITATK